MVFDTILDYIKNKQLEDITNKLDRNVVYHHCAWDGCFYTDASYTKILADFKPYLRNNGALPLYVDKNFKFTSGICPRCYDKQLKGEK